MIREALNPAGLDTFLTGFGVALLVSSLTMTNTSSSRLPDASGIAPSGQFLGDAIHERDPALRVRRDDGVADARHGRLESSPLRSFVALGPPSGRGEKADEERDADEHQGRYDVGKARRERAVGLE